MSFIFLRNTSKALNWNQIYFSMLQIGTSALNWNKMVNMIDMKKLIHVQLGTLPVCSSYFSSIMAKNVTI